MAANPGPAAAPGAPAPTVRKATVSFYTQMLCVHVEGQLLPLASRGGGQNLA